MVVKRKTDRKSLILFLGFVQVYKILTESHFFFQNRLTIGHFYRILYYRSIELFQKGLIICLDSENGLQSTKL